MGRSYQPLKQARSALTEKKIWVNPVWTSDYLDKVDGHHFNRLSEPISMREYFHLLAIPGYRIVKQEHIGDYFVSTVWLGLNHGYSGSVLIFETMVFNQNPPENYENYHLPQERYATEQQAFQGHAKIATETRLLVKLLKDESWLAKTE